jgi:RNA polymerase sigma-70 factor (ECF subfamily)
MHGDGGGKVPAIARPIHGAERVGRAWANWAKQGVRVGGRIEAVTVNGQPGAKLTTADGELLSVMALDIVGGKVKAIRNVLNPDKLRHLGPVADTPAVLQQLRTRR